MAVPTEATALPALWPSIPTSGHVPEMSVCWPKGLYRKPHSTLFLIASNWKQLKYSSIVGRINEHTQWNSAQPWKWQRVSAHTTGKNSDTLSVTNRTQKVTHDMVNVISLQLNNRPICPMVIEIRILVNVGGKGFRSWKLFCILIWVGVTWVITCIKMYQAVHRRFVQVTVYNLNN